MELFSQNQARAAQRVNWNLQGNGAKRNAGALHQGV
jgi:hypothetical protein